MTDYQITVSFLSHQSTVTFPVEDSIHVPIITRTSSKKDRWAKERTIGSSTTMAKMTIASFEYWVEYSIIGSI